MANNKKIPNIKNIKVELRNKLLSDMRSKKAEYMKRVDKLHVYIAQPNKKTKEMFSVSLMPVLDCKNCMACSGLCYDLRNDCIHENCRNARARNSAIYACDPERFFNEIQTFVYTQRFFRYNIGGDMPDATYFDGAVRVAENTPGCEFLIFTKMFSIVNDFIDSGHVIPKNLHVVFSNWIGQKEDNPHNLPTSNPLFFDGRTTAKDGDSWCNGNCAECFRAGEGCWALKTGEGVVFPIH